MKTLYESILDIDNNIDNFDKNIKDRIRQFLKDNFKGHKRISNKPNKDGKYEVSSMGNIEVKNTYINSLTNGLFVWSEVKGSFFCNYCHSLTSLEGAPEKVVGYFSCNGCDSLTSLEGAPKEVGRNFNCNGCDSLTSLEGAPEKVSGNFSCGWCDSLTSLEGAPKEVGRNFNCGHCGKQFTEKDVKNVSDVKGEIYC